MSSVVDQACIYENNLEVSVKQVNHKRQYSKSLLQAASLAGSYMSFGQSFKVENCHHIFLIMGPIALVGKNNFLDIMGVAGDMYN